MRPSQPDHMMCGKSEVIAAGEDDVEGGNGVADDAEAQSLLRHRARERLSVCSARGEKSLRVPSSKVAILTSFPLTIRCHMD